MLRPRTLLDTVRSMREDHEIPEEERMMELDQDIVWVEEMNVTTGLLAKTPDPRSLTPHGCVLVEFDGRAKTGERRRVQVMLFPDQVSDLLQAAHEALGHIRDMARPSNN